MNASRRLYSFTVTGSGQFPVDMLRRDQAWPASTDDALRVAECLRTVFAKPPVSIRLCALDFTPGRWQSFGWTASHVEWI